jgi:hypothetical protein
MAVLLTIARMSRPSLLVPLAIALVAATCCNPSSAVGAERASEHLTEKEKAEAASLKPAKDPVWTEIVAFRFANRQLYNTRKFAELEKTATELRKEKPVFGNGYWKIAEFYHSFECREDEPESMWQLHEEIHKAWIEAFPKSITARTAYAAFLCDYAWRARTAANADEVTKKGWELFSERLATAREVIQKARALPEKDPILWVASLRVGLGENWPKEAFDLLMKEALALEPKLPDFHNRRAHTLLPRWHGEPGEWEAYAAEAAARPDSLGAETYARIVMYLTSYHGHIFRESKASWPKTRDGLKAMIEKYPESLSILSMAALLAAMADDRASAKVWFDKIGDRYLVSVWNSPERFVHARHWAETGEW